jgi:hypothetical protein
MTVDAEAERVPTTTQRTPRSGARAVAAFFGEDSERAFAARFALLAAAAVLVPWAVSLADLSGPLRYLVPFSGAALIVLTYLRRSAEALLTVGVLVAFYDSIDLHVDSFKQIDEMAVGLLFLIAFARVARAWREWSYWPRDGAILGAVALGVISSLVYAVPITTWAPAILLITKGVAFLYAAMWTRFRAFELSAGTKVVLAVGLVVMVLGVIELFNPIGFQQFFGLNEYYRHRGENVVVKSLFVHPALFGWFTALVALFLYARYTVSRGRLWLALALFMSIGPFLSARRRAILALGAGILAAFVESTRRERRPRLLLRQWWPVGAGMLVLIIIFLPSLVGLVGLTGRYLPPAPTPPPPLPGETPAPVIGGYGENPQARIALYGGSLQVARDYFPLGAGLGRYGSWMSRVDFSPLYSKYHLTRIRGLRPSNSQYVTDTFWPQILGELGVFGLLLYIGFMATLGLMLWREAGRFDGPLLQIFRLGTGMVFAQAIIESFASSMFHSPPRVYLLYLALGVVASIAWRRERSSEPAFS